MTFTRTARNKGRAGAARWWIASGVLVIAGAGCSLLDKGLEATAPDKIETSTLEVPANAGLIVNSAIGNFECALGTYIIDAGMMSGELMDATATAANWAFDTLGWSSVIHSIAPANLASQRVAQKLGSRNLGPGKLPPPYQDDRVDIWGQTREEWRRLNP